MVWVVVVSSVTMSPFTTFFCTTVVVVVVVFFTAVTLVGDFLAARAAPVVAAPGDFFTVDNGFFTPTALNDVVFDATTGDFN